MPRQPCLRLRARVSVLPRDVKFLLGVYGAAQGEERELLLALARESRQKGWWRQYGEAVPEWFEVYVGLEAEAATLRNYEGGAGSTPSTCPAPHGGRAPAAVARAAS